MSNALLSVYDKTGIEEFAKGLVDLGWTVYASGGTAKRIMDGGIAVTDVAELVGGSAILGHRVVTLSRELYAGILADTDSPEDMKELADLGIPLIDLVCVDMYPLEAEIARPGVTTKDIVTQTDIGGPTMIRAAAKSRRIVLSVAEQRNIVLDWLKADRPEEAEFLEDLAARAEYEVARYIMPLVKHLNGNEVSGYVARKSSATKYGENPQQAEAGLYADNRVSVDPLGIDQFQHVQGMEQSYINLTDIDRLLQTATHIAAGFERNFGSVPALAVGVKHGNACGTGVGATLVEAVQKMLQGDTRAIFGGVVMVNGAIDKDVAETLMTYAMDGDMKRLLDGVVGSSVTDEALQLLSRAKLRVVINPALGSLTAASLDGNRRPRPVRGAVLEQPNYDFVQDLSAEHMQIHGAFTDQQKQDLILAWAVGATSNSNTITLVKDGQLIGNGVGQQDRVGAGQLAINRVALQNASKLNGACAYSDSFFPFPDGPALLAQAGVSAILTSSGSVADEIIIKTLTDAGVSLAMVPDKVGRGFYAH
jgi:phosphoribosylaminoimidazolecarboxamide formyltransferase/IMP cyclohydrolase